jgi:hypothetical protein
MLVGVLRRQVPLLRLRACSGDRAAAARGCGWGSLGQSVANQQGPHHTPDEISTWLHRVLGHDIVTVSVGPSADRRFDQLPHGHICDSIINTPSTQSTPIWLGVPLRAIKRSLDPTAEQGEPLRSGSAAFLGRRGDPNRAFL